MDPVLISIMEAAKILSLGRTSIYDLINSGALETRKIGRRRLVTVESIRRLAGN